MVPLRAHLGGLIPWHQERIRRIAGGLRLIAAEALQCCRLAAA
jgi:hypothetical protein